MTKPPPRASLPQRSSQNTKRRLDQAAAPAEIDARFVGIRYVGSPKHKRHPHLFNLEQYRGDRGDATLCDGHAMFQPDDMPRVPDLLDRARRAGLIGSHIWTVDDSGWIYELSSTNLIQNEHHGYPLVRTEAVAEAVFRHYRAWAEANGNRDDKTAALACEKRYGFKP